jgi:hypothetical protein
VHVGGKPREGHDKMILGHRDDNEQAGAGFPLAIVKDEVIGRPRYPESIKTGGKHKSLGYEKYNLQFVI